MEKTTLSLLSEDRGKCIDNNQMKEIKSSIILSIAISIIVYTHLFRTPI